MNTDSNTPWFTKRKTSTAPLFRLYCFPYGGSGSSIYRHWQEDFSEEVEVCPIQLPGRENRIDDPLICDMHTLLDDLVQYMEFDETLPFAFFGHSLGGILAFELSQRLRKSQMPQPVHLFISASPLPQRIREHIQEGFQYHTLPDEEFLEFFVQHSDGIPEKVLQSEEMIKMILPILKADLGLMETLSLTHKFEPLAVPITTFAGHNDEMVLASEVAQWEQYTTASYSKVVLNGEHYFIHSEHDAIVKHINETILLYML